MSTSFVAKKGLLTTVFTIQTLVNLSLVVLPIVQKHVAVPTTSVKRKASEMPLIVNGKRIKMSNHVVASSFDWFDWERALKNVNSVIVFHLQRKVEWVVLNPSKKNNSKSVLKPKCLDEVLGNWKIQKKRTLKHIVMVEANVVVGDGFVPFEEGTSSYKVTPKEK